MAFNKANWIASAWQSDVAPRMHSYASSAETVATIEASGYFNTITNDLIQYDLILIVGSDDRKILEVTSATGAATVTTADYTGTVESISLAEGNMLVGNASGVGVALDTTGDGQIVVGNGTTVTSVAVSGDATLANTGALTIANGAVELGMLATGITPSHIVVYAGEFTTVGGDANETITQAGILATDLVHVTLHTVGATPRTITTAAAAAGQIDVVMSGDPSTDHVLTWSVLRAAA